MHRANIFDLHLHLMSLHRWIKTDCGRAKLATLSARHGPLAQLRLIWFVVIAAIRDWPLPDPDQSDDSTS